MPTESQAQEALSRQRELIRSLADPACYPHGVGSLSTIETHISVIVLTGAFAYKIKKPVSLGFLDFSTLDKRRFNCEEELRLNSRFAPGLYLGVVAIGGSIKAPRVGGDGPAIEYAVKMRQFDQASLADQVAARGDLTPESVTALAQDLASFHHAAARAGAKDADEFGSPDAILETAVQNFAQIATLRGQQSSAALQDLETWTRAEHTRLADAFARRKREGRVRECHGDLHLGNIVLLDGRAQLFDCIEFNPALRWIDVMNELAFLVMDLRHRGLRGHANRLLNAYLEVTGDYKGLEVLPFYLVYRAMVRAKVALMRAGLAEGAVASESEAHFRSYLALARECMRPGGRFIVITHGLSGSGKTTLTQPLLEFCGGVRIRSDVERKRLHGIAAGRRAGDPVGKGLYRSDATEATYARLLDLARDILLAGFGVIVDATFLARRHRDLFRRLALGVAADFLILDFTAPAEKLRERVAQRMRAGGDASDADLAVLEHQIATVQPLEPEELTHAFPYDAARPLADACDIGSWRPLLERIATARSMRSKKTSTDKQRPPGR